MNTQSFSTDAKGYNTISITAKGDKLPNTNFTGDVWVNMVVMPEDDINSVAGKVTFEKGARTNWHTHSKGQILIVTEGIGYYQEKGKEAKVIKAGDVVKIPKDTEHWHGASRGSYMVHTAIVPTLEDGGTVWLDPVTDAQFDEALKSPKETALKLTPEAIKNHRELWPDYESKAAETDPELIEIFDNWAFDEVVGHGDIDTKTRVMMIMGSTIAQGAITEYKMFVNAALNVGVTPIQVKEVLYQSVAYVGVAKVIDFLYAVGEIFEKRGIELPLEKQSTTHRDNRHEKGLALMKATFGERIEEMRANAPQDQKHIHDYLAGNCFGDYYTRGGLDMKTRELLTYSMLVSMGGADSQVRGHIQGNLNVGNDRETLIGITTQLLPYIGYPRTLNALSAIDEICPRK